MRSPLLDHPGELGWTMGVLLRAYQKRTDELVAHVPAGPRGFALLSTVVHHDPPSQLALAGRLGIDPTATTYLIDALVEAGLVERRQDQTDRRARRIVPTEAGRASLTECERAVAAAEEEFLAALPADARAGFLAVIARFATELRALDPALDPCAAVEPSTTRSPPAATSSRRGARR